MMNMFIQRMTALPGRYAITEPHLWILHGAYCLVEVDQNGTVWQLNQEGERDGELAPDGWTGNEIVLDARVM